MSSTKNHKGTGFLFGGKNHGAFESLCDLLYAVDLERGNVSILSGTNAFGVIPSNLPPLGIAGAGNPPPKDGAAIWYSRREDALYTFGGFSEVKKCIGNDFWKFNLSNSQWTWIAGDLNCSVQPRSPKYGSLGNFSDENYPGARAYLAYWRNSENDMFYFHGGTGAYFGSPVSSYQNHSNPYLSEGTDVWAYNLQSKRWAWIAGPSTHYPTPVSNEPGTSKQIPGSIFSSKPFAESKDGNLWLLAEGSAQTYWLWHFNTSSTLWEAVSQIHVEGRPHMRIRGNLNMIGSNLLILNSGRNITANAYRFQDVWSFYIPTGTWSLISGLYFSRTLEEIDVSEGSNIPNIGEFLNNTILPGMVGSGGISWKNKILLFGGLSDRYWDVVLMFSVCDSRDEIFNQTYCQSCQYGSRPSSLVTQALDYCFPICQKGSVWDGGDCIDCLPGKYADEEVYQCKSCPRGFFSNSSLNQGCISCSPGNFGEKEGETKCDSCKPGLYSPRNASVECIPCTNGYISAIASPTCTACPRGTFSKTLSNNCSTCGEYSITRESGSTSVTSCICQSGYFGKPYGNVSCLKCVDLPEIRCAENSTYPEITAGFFRDPRNFNLALICIPKEACRSTSSESLETPCARGYTGWICGSCIPLKFYKLGSTCIECPSFASKLIVFLFIMFILLFLAWKFLKLHSFYAIVELKVFVFGYK
jgi:hypothetical protein